MIDVKIYTTKVCAYCWAAKRLLEKKGIAYQEIDVSRDPDVRRWLVEQSGQRTVPQVFLGGVPIGGSDELHAVEHAGKLDGIISGQVAAESI